jgi:hypothetical protein
MLPAIKLWQQAWKITDGIRKVQHNPYAISVTTVFYLVYIVPNGGELKRAGRLRPDLRHWQETRKAAAAANGTAPTQQKRLAALYVA